LRVASGLILFVYVFFTFVNIGLGLFSPIVQDEMQEVSTTISRSIPGTAVLYGALLVHLGLAFYAVAQRGTLRMPAREAVQTVFGLIIPFFLIAHITFTRGAHERFGLNDEYGYLIGLIWGSSSAWTQAALVLLVWVHSCIGLHVWLRGTAWWRAARGWLLGFAVFVPGFALAGFVAEGRRISALFADPAQAGLLFSEYRWPDEAAFTVMINIKDQGLMIIWGLLALSGLAYLLRRTLRRWQSITIHYRDGPTITAPKGLTLLEMSRLGGVSHTALCGGKGRCTTCRVVIEDGAGALDAPSPSESIALSAVGAGANTRLACQHRPVQNLSVFRVFQADGRQTRAHENTGEERRLAILFLDMRGFTSRTTGQLPYDVVFLLNRFFDAIVPPITQAGGTVDKYLGDGLLAVFETADARSSADAALSAAQGIGTALATFNEALVAKGEAEVRIGIGLHLGDIVLGAIGAGRAPRTIIGDAVNTASRLEAKTKDLGVSLLVTNDLLDQSSSNAPHVGLIELELRGVDHPVHAKPCSDPRDLAAFLHP